MELKFFGLDFFRGFIFLLQVRSKLMLEPTTTKRYGDGVGLGVPSSCPSFLVFCFLRQ